MRGTRPPLNQGQQSETQHTRARKTSIATLPSPLASTQAPANSLPSPWTPKPRPWKRAERRRERRREGLEQAEPGHARAAETSPAGREREALRFGCRKPSSKRCSGRKEESQSEHPIHVTDPPPYRPQSPSHQKSLLLPPGFLLSLRARGFSRRRASACLREEERDRTWSQTEQQSWR